MPSHLGIGLLFALLGFAGAWLVLLPVVGVFLGHRAGILCAFLFAAWLGWAAATGQLTGSGFNDEPQTCYDRQGSYRC